MSKFLLAILLLFATAAVVAHGILIYKVSTDITLIAEEETHDHHNTGKDTKDSSKEKLTLLFEFVKHSSLKKLHTAALDQAHKLPRGFNEKPENPPEAI